MNEFNEYVHECFSAAGDIVIKSMMDGYLVYLNGKLIGDICSNELFLKRTPTSDRLLADSELRYPYEGSKTLMHIFDRFEDADLIAELLKGMYAELPERKPKKAKWDWMAGNALAHFIICDTLLISHAHSHFVSEENYSHRYDEEELEKMLS